MISLFNEIKALVEARYNLARLDVTEKSVIILTLFVQIIVFAILASMILFVLSLSLGYYLGIYWNNIGLGFLVVTGIYILLFIIFIIFRKSLIIRPLSKILIRRLYNKNREEDDEENDI